MRRATSLFTPAFLLAAIQLTACSADDDGEAVAPDFGSGKSDAIDQVDDRGVLELDATLGGSFTEDLEFHGYRLSVRPGADVRLEITRNGTSKNLDTTLFVYGPARAGAFGTSAIAFDDDSGWGRQSRLSSVELTEGGEYLVVVGTHDARGRGNYRVKASCNDGECAPLPPVAGCDEIVANNILFCMQRQVDDTAADPETDDLTWPEALAICTDAEALGPVFDNLCNNGSAPFCAAGFEAFAQTMGPACQEELAPFAVECVFGNEYRDHRVSRDLVVGVARTFDTAVGLSELERAQVIAAVRAAGSADVETLDAAFDAVDGGEFNRTELWDRTNARPFVVYEFAAGDTSIGAYFAHGTTDVVAVIGDGWISRCSAGIGPAGGACSDDDDCSVGTCVGAPADGVGRCTELGGFGEQDSCSADAPCDLGQGLICAGLSRSDDGLCLPAWMRGNFGENDGEEFFPIPDGQQAGIERRVMVNGLATVDMDVELDLDGFHQAPEQLRVTLVNPSGNEVTVPLVSGDGSLTVGTISGFSGDEDVNGEWILRIADPVAGNIGNLFAWRLTIGSRFD
jgi:hypothetical protein